MIRLSGLCLPGAAAELDVQRPLEQPAIGQAGQAVVGGNQLQRFLGLAQIRLDPLADAHLANEHPAEQPHAQHHQCDDRRWNETPCRTTPQNRVPGRSRRDHQRISLQLPIAIQPDNAVHLGGEHRVAGGRLGQEVLKDFAPWPMTCRSATPHKGRRASNVPSVNARNIAPLSSILKLLKNWSKYDILIPASNTPWNWPLRVVDPPGDRNDPLAIFPTANRRADVRHGRDVLLVKPEVFAICHAVAAGQCRQTRSRPTGPSGRTERCRAIDSAPAPAGRRSSASADAGPGRIRRPESSPPDWSAPDRPA